MEENKCHSYFQEGQAGVSEKLQAIYLYLDPREDDGANNPVNHFQAH